MSRSSLLLIIALIIVAFGQTLGHKFVGDDKVLFENNMFYSSLSNVKDLFNKNYFINKEDLLNHQGKSYHSGSVGYRPVLSLSYFLDASLWRDNPFGYHAHNLILHIINSLFVFCLLSRILKQNTVALLAAVLFAVHPLKAEAVSNIGYRADLYSTFFAVVSFLFFLRYKDHRWNYNLYLSWLMYFLAIFSKESAVILPVVIVLYDWIFRNEEKHAGGSFKPYLGYGLILLFWTYIYFFVFPNQTINNVGYLGANGFEHTINCLWLFCHYVIKLLFPLFIKIIPPFYAPIVTSQFPLVAGLATFVIATYLIGTFIMFKKSREVSFFLLWFLISILPVINIIPIANPYAHRFMYLPSIGLLTVLAFAIQWAVSHLKNHTLVNILRIGIVSWFVFLTMYLNHYWRDNKVHAKALIKYYPQHTKGYFLLGVENFNEENCSQASKALKQAEALKTKDARTYYMLGVCSERSSDKQQYLAKAISLSPNYFEAYKALAQHYINIKDLDRAIFVYGNYVNKFPSKKAYQHLINTLLLDNRTQEAQYVLKRAQRESLME